MPSSWYKPKEKGVRTMFLGFGGGAASWPAAGLSRGVLLDEVTGGGEWGYRIRSRAWCGDKLYSSGCRSITG